ncbi:hypothetical protein V8E36_002882, partial [Tilletia maclaganii]
APWCPSLASTHGLTLTPADGTTREEAVRQHLELQGSLRDELVVYSDGSMTTDRRARHTGAGYVVYHYTATGEVVQLSRGSLNLRQDREVFDAEVFGLLCGVQEAMRQAREKGVRSISFFVDSTSVLFALNSTTTTTPRSSSGASLEAVRHALKDWLAQDVARRVRLAWVPAHDPQARIVGNEAADALAKRGCSYIRADYRLPQGSVSVATARRRAKEALQRKWRQRWNSETEHSNYRRM